MISLFRRNPQQRAAELAYGEGLQAHAQAAEMRLTTKEDAA